MQETASSIFAINPRQKDSETGEVMKKFNRGYAQPATGPEVEAMLSTLTALMEPFLMVFLGAIIGTIVLAMFLPIFNMGSLAS